METQKQKTNRILVVEDQTGPIENLSWAIRTAILKEPGVGQYSSGVDDLISRGIHVARSYSSASKSIQDNLYDLIFLDHRMPIEDQGNLERRDFYAFCEKIESVGYGLIPLIRQKNPQTTIIGTSACDASELREFGNPDYRVNKMSDNLVIDLNKILEERR